MEVESCNSKLRKMSSSSNYCCLIIKFIFYILTLIILLHLQSSSQLQLIPFMLTPFSSPVTTTFLPLKDLEYAGGAMNGNTWFMSSLNDTIQGDESEFLHFKGNAVLCIKGRNTRDGTKNFYALASPKGLPEKATLLKGLTFVSDTYYDYGNLWHGLNAMMPFVGWSMSNKCAKPSRWVLFHWAELRLGTGHWLKDLTEATFGRMVIETFEGEEGSRYCFEEAVVMRHDLGRMGREKKVMVSELLRCKARQACGILINNNTNDDHKAIIIRMTLLMRKGSRSFKNETVIFNVFNQECRKVNGCQLKLVRSDRDQTFCDQVKMMTETDIVVSPHGAQLTNMLFMDKGSSVMEFFPRGWHEYAGSGQYAHHWMASLSGMKHQGAWWDPLGNTDDCPVQYNKDHHQCFINYYKNGQVGHNLTYFAEWASNVLHQVRETKLQQQQLLLAQQPNNVCLC